VRLSRAAHFKEPVMNKTVIRLALPMLSLSLLALNGCAAPAPPEGTEKVETTAQAFGDPTCPDDINHYMNAYGTIDVSAAQQDNPDCYKSYVIYLQNTSYGVDITWNDVWPDTESACTAAFMASDVYAYTGSQWEVVAQQEVKGTWVSGACRAPEIHWNEPPLYPNFDYIFSVTCRAYDGTPAPTRAFQFVAY
jgi:hypothetical protein